MRGLRDTKRLKAWLRAGKTVELHDCDQVIAHIIPQNSRKVRRLPDFAARQTKIFGNQIFPAVDTVIGERGRY